LYFHFIAKPKPFGENACLVSWKIQARVIGFQNERAKHSLCERISNKQCLDEAPLSRDQTSDSALHPSFLGIGRIRRSSLPPHQLQSLQPLNTTQCESGEIGQMST
jgi:hypothetical protein